MNKNQKAQELEYKVEKPIQIKGGKDKVEHVVQCGNCSKEIIFPDRPADCQECKVRMDICRHGVACKECSDRLLLEWIEEGNMRAEGEQLEQIKSLIKKAHNKEVFINQEGYLEIKK